MNYEKYNRSFVMLTPQGREAKAAGRAEAYLKVETGNNKGAMRCTVKNLAYDKKGYDFRLLFLGKRKEKMIHMVMGQVEVNNKGAGESYFRFDPLNMDGNGNGYQDFSVAVIAAASKTDVREPLHPVLKGLLWVGAAGAKKPDAAASEAPAPPWESPAPATSAEEPAPPCGSPAPATSAEEPAPAASTPATSAEEPAPAAPTAPESPQPAPAMAAYNRFYNQYLRDSCRYTNQTAAFYQEIAPFAPDADRTGARWLRMMNTAGLPLVSPGAHWFATRYQHYLFGIKNDGEGQPVKFYFAIPGRQGPSERPDGGRSGFGLWQPIKGSPPHKPLYGYWILAVDAANGEITDV